MILERRSPNPLPADRGLISILSIFVLAAHLIAIDLAMAGPLACIWLGRRAARRGDAHARALEVRLARHSMLALVIGIALGTVQLGLLRLADDRGFFAAVGRVPPARLWFALAEIVFFFGCMAAYLEVRRWSRQIPLLSGVLAVLAATDLMYHFPPLFAMLNLLASRADLSGLALSSSLYRTLLLDPEVMAMVAHVWLAAIALTGVAVMRLAVSSSGPAPAEQNLTVAIAARWALAASLVQLPVGLWVLLAVPERSRTAPMGGDLAGTLLFGLAIVATLALLHHLAAAALGDTAPAQVRRSVTLTLCVVLLMTAALDRTRMRLRENAVGLAAAANRPAALWMTPVTSANLSRSSPGNRTP